MQDFTIVQIIHIKADTEKSAIRAAKKARYDALSPVLVGEDRGLSEARVGKTTLQDGAGRVVMEQN